MANWTDVMETVVKHRRRALVGYAFLVTGSLWEAEDVAQEAIMRTFSRGRSQTTVEAAEAYIKKAIVREAMNRARHTRVVSAANPILAAPVTEVAPDGWVGDRVDIRDALLALTMRERACVVMRFFDDMTVPDIARAQKLSEGTVKRYLFNATDKLRERLGSEAVDPVRPAAVRIAITSGGR